MQVSKQQYTEHELVSSLKVRDEVAFSYLYDNYSVSLNGVIFMLVNDVTLAEDILQEAFLKIWNNIDLYDETKGKLYTWMRRIAHNLALDTMKSSQYKNQNRIVTNESVLTNIAVNNNVINKFESNDFKRKLEFLDEKQQILINMSYYQGYTQKEIAKELEIPEGTVKTRIRSAIIELRKIFT